MISITLFFFSKDKRNPFFAKETACTEGMQVLLGSGGISDGLGKQRVCQKKMG